VDESGESPFARAISGVAREFGRFTGLPFAIQLPGVAAIVLIFGSLMPWATEAGFESASDYASGIDFNTGELTVLTGIAAILLVARLIRRRRLTDSGGVAGLGLLACALVLVEGISLHHNHFYSLAWGIYLSAAAALTLLLSGFLLIGGPEEPLPPPD
jgi:hypothetical protein